MSGHHTYQGIIATDLVGTITICNTAAQQMLGLPQSVVGNVITSLDLDPHLLDGIIAGQKESSRKYQLHGRTLMVNHAPLSNGNCIIGTVTILHDLTEMENLLSELESFRSINRELEEFIANSYDGFIITDGDGTVIKINDALLRVTNLFAEHFIGKKIDSLYKNGCFVNEPIAKLARINKQVTTGLTRIRTGKEVMVTSKPVLNDDGQVIRVVTNVKDMTDIINLQQQLTQARFMNQDIQQDFEKTFQNELLAKDMVTCNHELLKTLALTKRIAAKDVTILLQGESGVGKEVFAGLIHQWSKRKGSFVKINCGAIPGTLLESEFFGYSGGAFTGAQKGGKPGLFATANNGTLFLDEIEDLPLDLQGKFLRFLQDQEFRPLGGTKVTKVNVRLIAASNRDLTEMIRERRFRIDLYYRLNVLPIYISPLRDRKEDIPLLMDYFLKRLNKKHHTNRVMTPGMIERFLNYHWPGNVRELMNVLERLVITSESDIINKETFTAVTSNIFTPCPAGNNNDIFDFEQEDDGITSLKEALERTEKLLLTIALKKYKKSRQVGQALGISHTSVLKKMKKYQIS